MWITDKLGALASWVTPNFIKEVMNWSYCQTCFGKLLEVPEINQKFQMIDTEGKATDGMGKTFLGVLWVFMKVPDEIADSAKALDAYCNDPLKVLNEFFIDMELMGSMKVERELIDSGENGKFVLVKFIPIFTKRSFRRFLVWGTAVGFLLYYLYHRYWHMVVNMIP